MDSTFAMGHVVIRHKSNVVGNDDPFAVLFRCIQSMNPVFPFNTCYTGGEAAITFFFSQQLPGKPSAHCVFSTSESEMAAHVCY